MPQEDSAEIQALNRARDALGEHWESVQIVVSRHDVSTGETITRASGSGNFHARLGSVRTWVNEMDLKDQMIAEDRAAKELGLGSEFDDEEDDAG